MPKPNRSISFHLHARLWSALFLLIILPCCRTQPRPNAEEFVADAEERLGNLSVRAERADWVHSNFITFDTEILSAQALSQYLEWAGRFSRQAALYRDEHLSPELTRKLNLMTRTISLAAPADDEERTELAEITKQMEALYGTGRYCPDGKDCQDLEQLTKIMAESRDPQALLEAWTGWRTISPPIRDKYIRFVELANKGAREIGYDDLGVLWRSAYDMPPDDFIKEVDRLWEQVRPLYESLHCYVRKRLADRYGAEIVPLDQPIPAHLLGNMWSQLWANIYDVVAPEEFLGKAGGDLDLTAILQDRQINELEMVRYGEGFFTSLGFDPMPQSFWQRSLFTKPADRDVVCHASAWDIDGRDDLRIKMCIDITGEDFTTIHHELGHNIYQRAYSGQSFLFRDGAHGGFHEGIGDTIVLSITPGYLKQVGLIDEIPQTDSPVPQLLRLALDKIAFLPFGLLVDRWRWGVLSGKIPPEHYNQAWWELREKYQGIRPPVTRTEKDFDPGAKYHIPANTTYTRYFLAHILQFQFHRALCKEAGQAGIPLHQCSIYNSKAAGKRLQAMLEMGASRPWPEALEAISGER